MLTASLLAPSSIYNQLSSCGEHSESPCGNEINQDLLNEACESLVETVRTRRVSVRRLDDLEKEVILEAISMAKHRASEVASGGEMPAWAREVTTLDEKFNNNLVH